MFLLRRALDPVMPVGYPYLLAFVAVLLSASLFNHGSGLVATALSALLAATFYLPPVGPAIGDTRDIIGLVLFLVVGTAIALVVETMHKALAELERSEHERLLLLKEFRHRARNDLNSLVGLLLLRARSAPSDAAREGLREAAEHAMALARVHTRLAPDNGSDDARHVNTRDFIVGLCADLEAALAGDGLRPVAVVPDAEPHMLFTERAVQLGLVLNETVTNALKYAFPEERAGTVRVRFAREDSEFVLAVADDGVGIPRDAEVDGIPAEPLSRGGTGLGTRLLRALASQLRGSFSRGPGPGGVGTVVILRFPVEVPGPPFR